MKDTAATYAIPDSPVRSLQDCTDEIQRLTGQLETLTRDTGQFTYIVTHDLQAPLRTIAGFLELLEKKYGATWDDTAKQYVAYAHKEALRMKAIIFALLEYSRLGTTIHEFETVDTNVILQEAKDDLAGLLENKKAVIKAGDMPVLHGSAKLLRQLFRHLLDNGIKFNESEQPEVIISAARKGKQWEICVSDNGIGIEPAFAEKIFVILRRLHADEKKYTGTGVGLAVAKKIVEMHGGTIRASPNANGGTSLYFTLCE